MNIQKFVEDSPLGIGWLMGGIPLREAIAALAERDNLSKGKITRKYNISSEDLAPR